jgi:hypothetical protein
MLTEVPVAFRAYYKVEVPPGEMADLLSAEVPAQPVAPVEPVEPVVEAMPEPMVDTPELVEAAVADAESAANGKRSLGFFAH